MKALMFQEANLMLNPPEGYDPDTAEVLISTLPVRRDEESGTMSSYWMPSADELAILNNGGAIALIIHGQYHPPIALEAVPVDYPKPATEQGLG